MEAINLIKIFENRIEKCHLYAEPDCSYGQLYDFGCALTSFALAQMKAEEERQQQKREAKEQADALAAQQAQEEQHQE